MGRIVKDTRLESRESRLKLKARKEPYWRSIQTGIHLGYYKGATGKAGNWYVRTRKNGKYNWRAIAEAEDTSDADGVKILSYSQAIDKARDIAKKLALGDDHERNANYTVKSAVEDYLNYFKTNGKKSFYSTERQIQTHILPAFGEKLVANLTYSELDAWKNSLANSSKRLRTSKFKKKKEQEAPPQKFKVDDGSDPDYHRKRRATANRILTIIKAILNYAYRSEKTPTNAAWVKLKPFRNVSATRIRFLSEAEITRLLNHCEKDFRELVRGALLTGARYGELTSLRVRDFKANKISIYQSKSGKPRHVPLNKEGIKFFTSITAGKNEDDLIFTAANGNKWGNAHQSRPFMKACSNAKIIPAASFHHLRHAYASALAMRGVALQVIADVLGHSDTRITHKHYAHLMPSYVADVINLHLPNFGETEPSNVVSIKPIEKKDEAVNA